jgi:Flp pilus assembly protein TadG
MRFVVQVYVASLSIRGAWIVIGNKMLQKISAFRGNRHGGVAILFAVALIPMLIFVGAAVDYAAESRDASALAAATDAAALAAVSPSSPAYKLAQSMSGDGTISVDSAAYVNLLKANLGNRPNLTLNTPVVTLTKVGSNVTSTVVATASVKTMMMGMFGTSSVKIGKTSNATVNLPTFVDFYLLLDNSPSMGIGASPTDISNLETYTASDSSYLNSVAGQSPCGFACHDLSQNGNSPATDTYTIARANNVTLRIDLLRTATQQLMNVATTAEQTNGIPGQYRFAVYTLGATSTQAQSTPVTNVVPLSSNLSSVATQAAAVDLMTVDNAGEYSDQDTSFDTALPAIAKVIPNGGDGSSTNSRQQVLVFITDGVADENLNGTRTIEVVNQALCTAIQQRSIQIAILYTTYYPIKNNGFYMSYVDPLNPSPAAGPTPIETALQNCASSPVTKYYAEVQPGGDVSKALAGLFSNIIATSRLTH